MWGRWDFKMATIAPEKSHCQFAILVFVGSELTNTELINTELINTELINTELTNTELM